MASGILRVPKPYLPEVIGVIRTGLLAQRLTGEIDEHDPVYVNLTKWCTDMETFMTDFRTEEDKGNGQPIQ